MSSKIFVHKPLKRSEARRLSEEPRPVEAHPGPSVRLLDAPDPDKEKRVQERLARREEERKVRQLLNHLTEHLRPVIIPGSAFLRWLIENLGESEEIDDQNTFIQSNNLLILIDAVGQCVVCGSDSPVKPRGSAFLVWPDVFEEADKPTMGAVACPRCANLQPRLYARIMARAVWEKRDETLTGRLCKLKLLEADRRMLKWVETPRLGSDDHAVDRALRTGVFSTVLDGVGRIIENENNWLGSKISDFHRRGFGISPDLEELIGADKFRKT